MDKNIDYRNPFIASSAKPLYSQAKIDAMNSTKMKTNGRYIAFPDPNTVSIGILPIASRDHTETIKLKDHAPLMFLSPKLNDFEFSNEGNFLASTSKTDSLVRIWKIEGDYNWTENLEVDTPICMLAGHEKRIDIVRFHSQNSEIVTTVSQDKTIKIWDTNTFTDRITLDIIGGTVHSLCFSQNNDIVVTGNSDGNIYFYDPRAQIIPIRTSETLHITAKPFKLCTINPSSLFLSTGFNSEGLRNISLWDFRNSKTPVGTFVVQEKSSNSLLPIADENLPVVYLTGKGESIRMFECNGPLVLNSFLKLEKPYSHIELLKNVDLDQKKCEIAKFLCLTSDREFDVASVFIPRAKAETVFQEDLYPVKIKSKKESTIEWFDGSSLKNQEETLIVSSKHAANSIKGVGRPSRRQVSGLSNGSYPGEECSTKSFTQTQFLAAHENFSRSNSQKHPNSTANSSFREDASISDNGPIKLSRTKTCTKENSEDIETICGFLEYEVRGWFKSQWQKRWVSLKPSKIYASNTVEHLSLKILASYSGITNIKTNDEAGFEFEFDGTIHRLRALNIEERDVWLQYLVEKSREESAKLPPLPKNVKANECRLFAQLEVAEETNPLNIKWVSKPVTLDNDGIINIYESTAVIGKNMVNPVESIDLSLLLSIRKAINHGDIFSVQIETKRFHFKARSDSDASDWIQQIKAFRGAFGFDLEAIEGPCKGKWLVYARNKLFSYSSQFSSKLIGKPLMESQIVSYGKLIEDFTGEISEITPDLPKKITLIVDSGQLDFEFEGLEDFIYWVQGFDKIRRSNYNLARKLGILKEGIDFETVLKSFNPEDSISGVNSYDEKRLQNGTLKILMKITDSYAIAVEPIANSLSADASFVLDTGNVIYHWTGEKAGRIVRAEGLNLAAAIRKYRGSRPIMKIADSEDLPAVESFFKELGITTGKVNVMKSVVLNFTEGTKLQIYGNTEHLPRKITYLFQGKKPLKNVLSGSCIVHNKSQVYAWFEKGVLNEQKIIIKFYASKLAFSVKDVYGYTFYSEEYQGRETPLFKAQFLDFPSDLPISMRLETKEGNIAKYIVQEPINIKQMLGEVEKPKDISLTESGTFNYYRIQSFEKMLMEKKNNCIFSQIESYVVSYFYELGGIKKCLLYFWQGSRSSIIEKGTSAVISMEMSKEIGYEASQIRVLEGKEPPSLYAAFSTNSFIILKDKFDLCPSESDPVYFAIRECEGNHKAYQVYSKDIGLCSDTLVMLTDKDAFIYSPLKTASVVKVVEWVLERFGGNRTGKYISGAEIETIFQNMGSSLKITSPMTEIPKLFSCSSASGMVKIESIWSFTQEDLDTNIVMILDAIEAIYIWYGKNSKPSEQSMAIKTMQSYVKELNRTDKKILVTYPYQEPFEFTRHFFGFSKDKYPKEFLGLKPKTLIAESLLEDMERKVYSKEFLLSGALPDYIDKKSLELYLSDEEFLEVFSIQKADYMALQPWKRDGIKIKSKFY